MRRLETFLTFVTASNAGASPGAEIKILSWLLKSFSKYLRTSAPRWAVALTSSTNL